MKVRALSRYAIAVNMRLMDTRFSEIVTTEAVLRETIGFPVARVATKARSALDRNSRAFVAACPFVLVASADAGGNMDVSPKGDAPGFVRVLDDSTLAIPDRTGNRRADTFMNILQRPHVGLIFLVPGVPHTLRASGRGLIVRDPWLRNEMVLDGIAPDLALVVKLDEVFFHCPKCIARSKLWDHGGWPDPTALAGFEQIKASGPAPPQEATCTH